MVWERFYDWALSEPGTFLTALGQYATVPFLHSHPLYQKLFVEAGLRYWEEYTTEGKRYLVRGWRPEDLWSIPNGIKGAMVTLSGRNDWVLNPLPPGGLPQLVKELKLPVGVRAS